MTAPKPRSERSHDHVIDKSNVSAVGKRRLFDPETSKFLEAEVYNRRDLSIEFDVPGPAIVVESQTTTIVSKEYSISVNDHGHLILTRQSSKGASE